MGYSAHPSSEKCIFEVTADKYGFILGDVLVDRVMRSVYVNEKLQAHKRALGARLECCRITTQCRIKVENRNCQRCRSDTRPSACGDVHHGGLTHKTFPFIPEGLQRCLSLDDRGMMPVVITFLEILEDHRCLGFKERRTLRASDLSTKAGSCPQSSVLQRSCPVRSCPNGRNPNIPTTREVDKEITGLKIVDIRALIPVQRYPLEVEVDGLP